MASPTIYTLEREQLILRPVGEVFAFFADAANLEVITPPWLGFHVLTPAPIRMFAGARIEYRLYWHCLPLRWVTLINDWSPPLRFSDVQLRGPYRLWEHEHTFAATEGGTLMRDVVRYALPLGPLGRLARRYFVKADLERVFDYRAARIREVFDKTK